jgi:hypothetical protein
VGMGTALRPKTQQIKKNITINNSVHNQSATQQNSNVAKFLSTLDAPSQTNSARSAKQTQITLHKKGASIISHTNNTSIISASKGATA